MTEEPRQADIDGLSAANNRTLGIWARLKLFAGRPRRLFDNWFRKRHIKSSLARRTGQCQRCGACCQMGNRCRFLVYIDGLSGCKIYNQRQSPNCREFPMSEHDLRDRDVILPQKPCGYRFNAEREK